MAQLKIVHLKFLCDVSADPTKRLEELSATKKILEMELENLGLVHRTPWIVLTTEGMMALDVAVNEFSCFVNSKK